MRYVDLDPPLVVLFKYTGSEKQLFDFWVSLLTPQSTQLSSVWMGVCLCNHDKPSPPKENHTQLEIFRAYIPRCDETQL